VNVMKQDGSTEGAGERILLLLKALLVEGALWPQRIRGRGADNTGSGTLLDGRCAC
jgi:hypothetical protein